MAAAEGCLSRLDEFVAPKPNFALIGAMTAVNRIFMLKGVVGLRDLPPLNRIAGLRGISNIRTIDFPEADRQRLTTTCSPDNVAFVTPNHPEFFTDWMIDKEVSARICPKAAFWATNSVVNGLGKLAQKFWLANNLIAQIPGNSEPARHHSVSWALQGHSVLLHSEGAVGWHGDYVAPLMSGAAEMALEALDRVRKAGTTRPVLIAPIVWKLVFQRDVEKELLTECAYIEKRLGMSAAAGAALPVRVYTIYAALLARDEAALGLTMRAGMPFRTRHGALVLALQAALVELAAIDGPPTMPADIVRRARKRVRQLAGADSEVSKRLKVLSDMLALNLRLGDFAFAEATITQEGLAEHIKRIRNDYCKGTLRDTLNRFVPQPAGPRTAYIRVPEALDVASFDGTAESMMAEIRLRMQAALDTINRGLRAEGRFRDYPNPFHS
jgi:hypothetical protein